MSKLILVRHGQSEWNLQNKFTGWEDVNLTEKGKEEAKNAGRSLAKFIEESQVEIADVHTSVLKRAINTNSIILDELGLSWLQVKRSWRLNERHYGNFQTKDKDQVKSELGEEDFILYRRSYDVPPPEIESEDNSVNNIKYRDIPKSELPKTESLKDVLIRVKPYYIDNIFSQIVNNGDVLVVAHGNSLRALVKYIMKMSKDEILKFEIPTGKPLIIEFNKDSEVQKKYFLD